MSIVKQTARSAVIALSAAVLIGALPAGRAIGATTLVESAARMTLVRPQVELEDDYPAMVLPPASMPQSQSTRSGSLTDLVRSYGGADTGTSELNCLATAVYFEAKGEPLDGQLAVARVIMNRARSGRFASTLCGVVKQPSQFSFVRGGALPAASNAGQWRNAVGVAHVAMKDLYKSPAPDALYFHARRVAPGWGKQQVAIVGNHIFYR